MHSHVRARARRQVVMSELDRIAQMWKNISPEDIVDKNRYIDKLRLVEDFWKLKDGIETPLTSREDLIIFRKKRIEARPGVYCIYDSKESEVLYVGESKDLRTRIKDQLIGNTDRENGLLKFARLFFGFWKAQKPPIAENKYNKFSIEEKRKHIEIYLETIFNSKNRLRLLFMEDHVEATVLEKVLIKFFFVSKRQCRYNYLVERAIKKCDGNSGSE